MRVVLDTNVLRSGVWSDRGASREVLHLIDAGALVPVVTVPLVVEYESVLTRPSFLAGTGLSRGEVEQVLDYILSRAHLQRVAFLWRPMLPDPTDDCILECAVNGMAEAILTFNVRHFAGVRTKFGVAVLTPRELLRSLGRH